MVHSFRVLLGMAALISAAASLPSSANEPPKTWVDKDTGHRIIRLTEEAGSSGFYFNVNAYSPDGKLMAYDVPDGIHVLELATMKTRLLVPNPPQPADAAAGIPALMRRGIRPIVVGRKTNSIFFSKVDPGTKLGTIYKADMYTGETKKLVTLPPRASIATINADETLGVGTFNETEEGAQQEYGRYRPQTQTSSVNGRPVPQAGSLVQADNKAENMERRLSMRIPVVLYAINLETGKITELLHSTDWIGHMLFSPVDPTLLMYCHEGPWQKVDRIWMIRTDGSDNHLIHKRTMAMEIAGHEFWGLDGKTIWFDWQYPESEDFFVAGYNLETHRRTAFHLQRNEWSIHFNLTQRNSMFTGDGGDPGQIAKARDGEWIQLFRPEMLKTDGALNDDSFWQPGVFRSEHLVNMAHHDYHLEPNVRFSPDKKLVIFTSNMFGPSYVFGVEVDKAMNAPASEIRSTPELAKSFNPKEPRNVNVPAPELVPVQR
jgi:oligogalacturonide lyase